MLDLRTVRSPSNVLEAIYLAYNERNLTSQDLHDMLEALDDIMHLQVALKTGEKLH